MAEKKERPNVVGKGPALLKEMIAVFEEITAETSKLSGDLGGKVKTSLEEKIADFNLIKKMAFLKTVKAGETAWDCKEMGLELKEAIASGDESKVAEIFDTLNADLDELIHKTKTFVVRMT